MTHNTELMFGFPSGIENIQGRKIFNGTVFFNKSTGADGTQEQIRIGGSANEYTGIGYASNLGLVFYPTSANRLSFAPGSINIGNGTSNTTAANITMQSSNNSTIFQRCFAANNATNTITVQSEQAQNGGLAIFGTGQAASNGVTVAAVLRLRSNNGLILFANDNVVTGGTSNILMFSGGTQANQERLRLTPTGCSIGGMVVPSAKLHLGAGTATAGTAPLKFKYITLATTAATGTGVTATLTFTAQTVAPFLVGDTIVVAGVTPAGYNGTQTVTACTTTTVSFLSATTGVQTVAGTIVQGVLMGTAEAGAWEYDGVNFYATRVGTTRETVLSGNINAVTPTAPDRTITVNIGGTDYYIHAKTTND